MNLPVVALIGRPNVGKSALFNRIVGEHSRDRERRSRHDARPPFRRADWNGQSFWLVDTGGLTDDPHIADGRRDSRQVAQAIDEADLLLLVVDAQSRCCIRATRGSSSCCARRGSRGCSSPTRSTIPAPPTSTSSTSSAPATRFRSRRSTARTRATCSTSIVERIPAGAARARPTRCASPSSAGRTSASPRS